MTKVLSVVLAAATDHLRTVVVRPGVVYGGGTGIVADLLHIGEYKTYANTFTQKSMTPAHRDAQHAAFDEPLLRLMGYARGDEAVPCAVTER